MEIPHDSVLLRIFIGESDRHGHLPLIIELVDSEEKINTFLPVLDTMMSGGLITLEKARVIYYRTGETQAPWQSPSAT